MRIKFDRKKIKAGEIIKKKLYKIKQIKKNKDQICRWKIEGGWHWKKIIFL